MCCKQEPQHRPTWAQLPDVNEGTSMSCRAGRGLLFSMQAPKNAATTTRVGSMLPICNSKNNSSARSKLCFFPSCSTRQHLINAASTS